MNSIVCYVYLIGINCWSFIEVCLRSVSGDMGPDPSPYRDPAQPGPGPPTSPHLFTWNSPYSTPPTRSNLFAWISPHRDPPLGPLGKRAVGNCLKCIFVTIFWNYEHSSNGIGYSTRLYCICGCSFEEIGSGISYMPLLGGGGVIYIILCRKYTEVKFGGKGQFSFNKRQCKCNGHCHFVNGSLT